MKNNFKSGLQKALDELENITRSSLLIAESSVRHAAAPAGTMTAWVCSRAKKSCSKVARILK